jgi:hypothetical protein
MKIITKLIAATALAAATPAAFAAPIVSLADASAVTMTGSTKTGGGAQSFGPGITYAGDQNGYFNYSAGWGFSRNGSWGNTPMIGANSGSGSFTLTFDQAITGFLADVNWSTGWYADATMASFDAAGQMLESILLSEHTMNQVAPGMHGFADASGRIKSIRFSNAYIGIRNISVSVAAVPEPATWAMMLVGFGMAGVALRQRRRSPALRAA